MQIVSKLQLEQLFDGLAKQHALFVPGDFHQLTQFVPYEMIKGGKATLAMDQQMTLSPKSMYFPQTEAIYRFKTQGKQLAIETIDQQQQPQILFGVRHCDIHGIKCLDQVFLSAEYTDPQYLEKRNNTVVFALSCNEPWKTCFCTAMDVDQLKADGAVADVQVYEFEQEYGFIALSKKGEQCLQEVSALLKQGEDQVPVQKKPVLQFATQTLPQQLATMFEHPIWEGFAFKCLGCGTCTYICPSCHCFDINNKIRGQVGVKLRTWDSCMFDEYTLMAGGHQPRPDKKQRIRNRFLHKLQYFNEKHDMFLCTGCGRCVAKCPANIDITKFIEQVNQLQS